MFMQSYVFMHITLTQCVCRTVFITMKGIRICLQFDVILQPVHEDVCSVCDEITLQYASHVYFLTEYTRIICRLSLYLKPDDTFCV